MSATRSLPGTFLVPELKVSRSRRIGKGNGRSVSASRLPFPEPSRPFWVVFLFGIEHSYCAVATSEHSRTELFLKTVSGLGFWCQRVKTNNAKVIVVSSFLSKGFAGGCHI